MRLKQKTLEQRVYYFEHHKAVIGIRRGFIGYKIFEETYKHSFQKLVSSEHARAWNNPYPKYSRLVRIYNYYHKKYWKKALDD